MYICRCSCTVVPWYGLSALHYMNTWVKCSVCMCRWLCNSSWSVKLQGDHWGYQIERHHLSSKNTDVRQHSYVRAGSDPEVSVEWLPWASTWLEYHDETLTAAINMITCKYNLPFCHPFLIIFLHPPFSPLLPPVLTSLIPTSSLLSLLPPFPPPSFPSVPLPSFPSIPTPSLLFLLPPFCPYSLPSVPTPSLLSLLPPICPPLQSVWGRHQSYSTPPNTATSSTYCSG